MEGVFRWRRCVGEGGVLVLVEGAFWWSEPFNGWRGAFWWKEHFSGGGVLVEGALAGLGVVSKYKSILLESTKVDFQSTKVYSRRYKSRLSNYTKYIYKYANIL